MQIWVYLYIYTVKLHETIRFYSIVSQGPVQCIIFQPNVLVNSHVNLITIIVFVNNITCSIWTCDVSEANCNFKHDHLASCSVKSSRRFLMEDTSKYLHQRWKNISCTKWFKIGPYSYFQLFQPEKQKASCNCRSIVNDDLPSTFKLVSWFNSFSDSSITYKVNPLVFLTSVL